MPNSLCVKVVVLFFYFSCTLASAKGENAVQLSKQMQAKIERTVKLMTHLDNSLPKVYRDRDVLMEFIDYDPQKAITYVRKYIAYEPYVGVLRGADGVLATNAGNSWDQSLFLVSLLKDIGFEAQIVSGRLNLESAKMLLKQAFVNKVPPLGLPDVQKVLKTGLGESVKTVDVSKMSNADNGKGGLDKLNSEISKNIISILKKHSIMGEPYTISEDLVNAIAQDYAWVQWRKSSNEAWQNIYPGFLENITPEVTIEKTYKGKAPAEKVHYVAFRIYIEKSDEHGARTMIPIMDLYKKPASNLFKKQIVLSVLPKDNKSGFMIPLLGTQLAPNAKAFTKEGLVVKAEDIMSSEGFGASEFFATTSSKMSNALGGLGSAGREDKRRNSPLRLTGIFIETTLSTPQKKEYRTLRRLIDFRDEKIERLSDYAIQAIYDVDIGKQHGSVVLHNFYSDSIPFYKKIPWLYSAIKSGTLASQYQKMGEIVLPKWFDFELYSTNLLRQKEHFKVFRPTVFLAGHYTVREKEKALIRASDFIFNKSITMKYNAGKDLVQIDKYGSVYQGVRDTLLETILMESGQNVYREKILSNMFIKDLKELEKSSLYQAWDKWTKERASEDIRQGYVLLLAKGGQNWWRVDPKSGETLGMGKYGGSVMTEHISAVIGVGLTAYSAYAFSNTVESCSKTYANNKEMESCCIVGNLIVFYGTTVSMGAAEATGNLLAGTVHAWQAALGKIETALDVGFKSVGLASDKWGSNLTDPVVKASCQRYLAP